MWKTTFKNLNLKWYGLPKQTIPLRILKGCLPQILLGPFLNTLSQIFFKALFESFGPIWKLISELIGTKSKKNGFNSIFQSESTYWRGFKIMIFRVFINPKIATELLLSSKKTIERQRKSTVDNKRVEFLDVAVAHLVTIALVHICS